jgi:hypothetical protein
VDRPSVPSSDIAFRSSNSWERRAAAAFGMQIVWCNRCWPATGAASLLARPRGEVADGIAGIRGCPRTQAYDFVIA